MTPVTDSQVLVELATSVVRMEGQITAIQDQIATNTKLRADDSRATAETLSAIEKQVKATNGRVNALEAWKDRVIGAGAALSIMYAVATDLFGLLAK